MKPTLEQFMTCAARWDGEHRGIRYELSWHGASEYQPQGIWCWYIIVTQEQFYADDWAKLRLEPQERELAGSKHRHWSYETFPDCDPHGEWTFGEMSTYMGRDGKDYDRVKVGCDYNHSHNRDEGYWQGRDDLERDVKASIEKLVKMFPKRRVKCAYSGRWDDADKFFETNAGWLVHVSQEGKTFDHVNWQRKSSVPATLSPEAT